MGDALRSQRTKSTGENSDLLFDRASKSWEDGKLLSAFRLFLAGAKAGDTGAQFNLGYFYAVGIGVKRNRERAILWYKEAYRAGLGAAASNLAALFLAEGDSTTALKWYHRAIALRDADANVEVARIYTRQGRMPSEIEPFLRHALDAAPDEITQAAKEEARLAIRSLKKPKERASK